MVKFADGFSLIEVLIAMSLAIVVIVNVSSLFALSLAVVHESRNVTLETTLAMAKLEELRSAERGSAMLAVSPDDALERDVAGYVEPVDGTGEVVAAGPPVYLRRWTVSRSPADASILIFRVLVTTPVRDAANRGISGRDAGVREVVLVGGRPD